MVFHLPPDERCPDCGAPWPSTLTAPFKRLRVCRTCYAEKQRRLEYAAAEATRQSQARADAMALYWGTLTPEERKSERDEAID